MLHSAFHEISVILTPTLEKDGTQKRKAGENCRCKNYPESISKMNLVICKKKITRTK